MTNLRRLFLLTLLLIFTGSVHLYSQNYNMGNTTVNTCSGNFFDSGGSGGNYGANQNQTMTICSGVAGQCVRLVFTNFDLETNFDFLRLYDGPNTASPLIGTYTGNTSPGLITASSGCLTINFTSDASFNYGGWTALISCISCASGVCTSTCNGGPAPANDICGNAVNLGTLPLPTPCPGGNGALTTLNTTNLCATAATPYTSLLGCQPSGNMANPAADVWYRFNITGPSLNINIAGGLSDPNIGLYEGITCANLIPRGCAIGSNGVLNTTFGGLAAGTYFLQVSGGSITDQCDFSLTLQNNYDCAGCVIQSAFTATPPPVNGTYNAGQLVTFCLTISDYNQTSANWLHGVIPTFGSGWDMSTFTPISATNCSGAGNWNWYNTNVTSSATGNVTGPGFYYENPQGNPANVADGNPGNNFGDNNASNICDWIFCWSVRTLPVATCVQGANLNVAVNTTGDGESGSWGSLACTQDAVSSFFATLTCCQAPTITVIDPACPNANTGSATATGQGSGPWDYVWMNATGLVLSTQNNINGSSTINNLAPGSYTVQVTDNNGCTANAAFSITAPSNFTANMTTTGTSCFGTNTGSASVLVSGGTGGYTYQWSPVGSGSNPSNLAAGTYTVTVTDNRGCTATTTGVVPQPAQLVISTTSNTGASCSNSTNGTVTVTTNGGTAGYTYLWSTGVAGPTVSGVGPGAYTVTVTDSRGCTAFMTVAVTAPSALILNMNSTASSCGAANGTASVSVIGGVPGYTYQWSPSGGAGSSASGLVAGGYNVTVTDVNGCTAIGNVVVANSSGPTATISASTDVTCNGGANGSATVSVNGGAAPLSYVWSPSGGNGTTANGLSAGNYTVIVTDGAGCTSAASVVIAEPSQVTVSISATTDASCNGTADGSLSAAAANGTPGYSFNWNNGSTSATASGLAAGTYTVTVTDANGCTAVTNGSVREPSVVSVAISGTTAAACNGGSDGSATATGNGGTPVYSWQWSSGASTATATGLTAGTYTVTISDANGCTATTTAVISEPSALQLNVSANDANCGQANGSASVAVNGGTAPYAYAWNPVGGNAATANGVAAGNYTVVVTDANGCTATGNTTVGDIPGVVVSPDAVTDVTCSGGNNGIVSVTAAGGSLPYTYLWSDGSTNNPATGLTAGTYTVTVTDNDGCTSTLSSVVNEPALISISPTITTAHCGQADGTADISVSGGIGPYTYSWSTGATAATVTGLIAGNYTVTVTDANGCTSVFTANIPDAAGPGLVISTITDVSCNAGADGSIDVTANGGSAPYSYLWSNSSVGSNATGLPAGTYTVTVTDAFGCTADISGTIAEPSAIQLQLSSTPATCGSSNGSATVIANGGTPGYNYNWIPAGGNNATANNIPSGGYTIEVTDANGCTVQDVIAVTSANGPSASVLQSTDVSCNGGNDGSLTIDVTGGTAPITYVWSSGGSGTSGTGLSAGTYTVTVTDDNGCSSAVTAVINEPALLTLSGNSVTAHCGQADGSADVTVAGGTNPYSYAWSSGTSVTQTLNGVVAGAYTATVTDANGCTAEATVNIPDAPGPLAVINTVTDVSCNGGSDGSIDVSVNGGTAPYSYSWSNGGVSNTISGLSAGIYTVTVTDVYGCSSSIDATVNEPSALQLSFQTTDATCGTANGTASVTVNGGTAPYSYLWSNGDLAATAAGLAAGTWTVTVTDASGCSTTDNTAVSNQGGPVLTAGPVTNPVCNGEATGAAEVLVNSGNGPYTFNWIPAGGVNAQATGLTAGNYTAEVTDVNGCTSTLVFTITEPTPLVVNQLTTPVTCFGGADGTATIDAQGSTAPYTYDWNPGGVLSASRINLSAGTYTITVTDANGCTAVTNAIVNDPPDLTGLLTATDASCFGGNDGSASVVAGGGIAPYTWLWSDGSVNPVAGALSSGTYTVTITDNNGCTHQDQVVVGEAPAIVLNTIVTDATCGTSNGTAQVAGAGGNGVLNYVWSDGTVGVSISGLPAGIYTVTATDANGCTASAPAAISNQGGPSVSLLSSTDVSCNGAGDGQASVTVNSGNGPYTYNWSPSGGNAATAAGLTAGNYAVDITDVNGCTSTLAITIQEPSAVSGVTATVNESCNASNGSAAVTAGGGTGPYSYLWSNGNANDVISGITAGSYTVTITDANGCTGSTVAVVGADAAPAVTTTSTDLTCSGAGNGTADVTVLTGTGPFTYQWSNGDVTPQINNLSAGNYTCIVTDASGCTVTAVVSVQAPAAITIQLNVTDATCGQTNGSLEAVANGGSGALGYQWSNGDVTALTANLPAGTYTVTVTDANGCTQELTGAVGNQGGPVVSLQSQSDVSCNGGSDGSATVTVSSGSGPFSYSWSPSGGNAATASGLTAGAYVVNVTDNNGCQSVVNVQISEPVAINLSVSSTPASCGNANGSATVNANGGTGAYQYLWSNGDMTATAGSLTAGNYTVTVTDANGCTRDISIAVTQPSSLSITTAFTDVTCNGGNDGTAAVSVNGGTAPYTYLWNNGAVTAALNTLNAGVYTATVTDATGCSFQTSVAVSEPMALSVTFTTTDASCGSSNGSAQANVSGGNGVLTYSWSGGQSAQSITGVTAGTYTVTVTDGTGCSVTSPVTISNQGGPQLAAPGITDVSCYGASDGAVTVAVSSGTGPYTYQWSTAAGSGLSATGLSAGNYTVSVTDANGCITQQTFTIQEPSPLQLTTSVQPATCGQPNGLISTQASGGTGNYSYAWSNGAVSSQLSQLPAGTYTATVTDQNGCTASASAAITNSAGPLLAVNAVTGVTCSGAGDGSAGITVVSGTGPFTYNWLPSGGSGATANGLSGGNYTVEVTDANGCTAVQAIIVQEPSSLVLQVSVTPANCNAANGSAYVQVIGGTPSYSYQWSNGTTAATAIALTATGYTVTVTDANGCTALTNAQVSGLPGPTITAVSTTDVSCFGGNTGAAQASVGSGSAPYAYLWSSGDTTSAVAGLAAGSFTVTVTDFYGCIDQRAFSIQQPAPLLLTTAPLNMVSCFGGNDGSADATMNGGVPPYQYLWSNGDVTPTANNLSAGVYTATITDANGCSVSDGTQITEPSDLTLANTQVINADCFGAATGSAVFTAGGGTAPYTYLWSNGNTAASNTGLTAGAYTITATDANGCTETGSISIAQPPAILINAPVITPVSCFGGNNGTVSVSVSGGTSPYTYSWSNGATTQQANGLSAGNYTVAVTDDNGCTQNASVAVTEPALLQIQSSVSPILCHGQNNASIAITPNGGVLPYTYSWNNGAIASALNALSPGTYSVTVTDANNCKTDTAFIIIQPPVLTASVVNPDTICIGQSAVLSVVTGGGTPGYSYLWSNGQTGSPLPVSPATSTAYSVTVTDIHGCTKVVSNIAVPVHPALQISVSVDKDTICEGETVQLSTLASGGNGGPYTYSWSPLQGSISGFQAQPDTTTQYQVVLSDGCTVLKPTAVAQVLVHPLPEITFDPVDTTGCMPLTVPFRFTGITTAAAQYTWSFGDGTFGAGKNPSHIYMKDGVYDVTLSITDQFGCENTFTKDAAVTVYPLPVAFYNTQPQYLSILHPEVQFLNESEGAAVSYWDFVTLGYTTNDWNPTYTFTDTGRYWVQLVVISNEGCVDTFLNEVVIHDETTFYVPNAFTPNGDGRNESFTGYGTGIDKASFYIFDRWGKQVYESDALNKPWDGTFGNNGDPCPEGTYVYLFRVYKGDPEPVEISGRVTLVR